MPNCTMCGKHPATEADPYILCGSCFASIVGCEDDAEEEWIPVKGYEGLYSINQEGLIRREKKVLINRRGIRQVLNERILKPYYRRGKGYLVTLKRGDHIQTHLLKTIFKKHFSNYEEVFERWKKTYSNDQNEKLRI